MWKPLTRSQMRLKVIGILLHHYLCIYSIVTYPLVHTTPIPHRTTVGNKRKRKRKSNIPKKPKDSKAKAPKDPQRGNSQRGNSHRGRGRGRRGRGRGRGGRSRGQQDKATTKTSTQQPSKEATIDLVEEEADVVNNLSHLFNEEENKGGSSAVGMSKPSQEKGSSAPGQPSTADNKDPAPKNAGAKQPASKPKRKRSANPTSDPDALHPYGPASPNMYGIFCAVSLICGVFTQRCFSWVKAKHHLPEYSYFKGTWQQAIEWLSTTAGKHNIRVSCPSAHVANPTSFINVALSVIAGLTLSQCPFKLPWCSDLTKILRQPLSRFTGLAPSQSAGHTKEWRNFLFPMAYLVSGSGSTTPLMRLLLFNSLVDALCRYVSSYKRLPLLGDLNVLISVKPFHAGNLDLLALPVVIERQESAPSKEAFAKGLVTFS